MIGKTTLNFIVARELDDKRKRLKFATPDVYLTVEAKAIALTHELSVFAGNERYVVLRKSRKSYMTNPMKFVGNSITSGEQEYWLESSDAEFLANKKVAIVDDVMSTGGTAKVLLEVLASLNSKPEFFFVALTEGDDRDEFDGIPVISLANIPLPE
jgi:adenine phosphoribosyltransferase